MFASMSASQAVTPSLQGAPLQSSSIALNAVGQPVLHFSCQPTNGTQSDAHAARQSALRLELVDHGSTQARDLAYLGKSKYLQEGGTCHGFCVHEWILTASLRAIADKLSPATRLVPAVYVAKLELRSKIPQNPDGQAPTIAKSP
jgi:hypothetical protein